MNLFCVNQELAYFICDLLIDAKWIHIPHINELSGQAGQFKWPLKWYVFIRRLVGVNY